jgi:hypothetical protein
VCRVKFAARLDWMARLFRWTSPQVVQEVEHVVASNLVEIDFPTTFDEQIDGEAIAEVSRSRFLLATLDVLSRDFYDALARCSGGNVGCGSIMCLSTVFDGMAVLYSD